MITIQNFSPTSSIGHKTSLLLSLNLTTNSYTPENVGRLITPAKKLEDTIRLAELVIEVLQQNEEHHAEVSRQGKMAQCPLAEVPARAAAALL